jgi:predicted outer membrane repeat protein
MSNLLNRDRFNVKSTQGSGSGTITILILLLSLAVVFIFATGHASAESPIIYVNDSGGNDSWNGQNVTWENGTLNGPKKSIKNGTGSVTENGLIKIADGVYNGENNTNIIINKNLTILGESQSNTIIVGTNTTNMFVIQSGHEVSFCNLTLTNVNMGNSRAIYNNVSDLYVTYCTFTDNTIIADGGAIYNDGGNLVIFNSIFTRNNATNGGAIYNDEGTTFITDSAFTDNNATSYSGGAIASDGYLIVNDSTFTQNNADYGGAIVSRGNLIVNDSTFTLNTAKNAYGGAIAIYGNSTITNSTFTQNNAATGGAIFTTGSALITTSGSTVNYSILYLVNCTFTQNTAIEGGAICNALYSNTSISNNTFTSNSADWYGGAISNNYNLALIDSTFTDNHIIKNASIWDMTYIPCGGAIYNKGNLTVVNNTFTNNSAGWYGGAIYSTGNLTVTDSTFSDNCVTLQEGGISNSVFFPSGGAIHNLNGYLVVFNSIFNNNKAFYGGAIYNQNYLFVICSTFNGNIASGGAIFNNGGTSTSPAVIFNSTFIGNGKNYQDGGAIANFENDYLNLNNCTFINNTASEARGGAIHNQGVINVTESNFTGNSAGSNGMGGAIYNSGSIDLYFNSIVGNTANRGSGIYNDGGTFDVTFNWWGSNDNPISKTYGIGSCSPWLYMTLTANPATILNGQTSKITTNLNNYYDGITVTSFNPDMGHLADGCLVTFTTDLGTLSYKTITVNTINGTATATLKANETPGIAHLSAQVNNEIKYINVEIVDGSFTISHIMNVAVDVKNYLEVTKTLPTLITINGKLISQAQFLQLLCIATLQLKTGNITSINLQNVQLPSSSNENLKPGTLIITDYLELAQNITNIIQNNKTAPGNMTIFQGQIGFQSIIYMYCRVLNQYKTNNALPEYIAIRPWNTNNIPIKDTNKNTITIKDIYQTAYEVKNYAETTKTLPEYINIAGILVNQAEFLNLLTITTTQINNTNYTNLNLQNINLPPTNTEKLNMGTLIISDYIILAQNITNIIQNNKTAPGNMTIFQGQIGFQSIIYMYCRILTQYKINSALPTFITIKPWNTNNIPIKDTNRTGLTTQDVIKTAIEVKNFYEVTKNLPEYINVNGVLVNQGQFLQLMVIATLKLNNTDSTNINLKNVNLPNGSNESIIAGNILKQEYLDLALNTKSLTDVTLIAPVNMPCSRGQIGFKSLIYIYTKILENYGNTKTLPTSVEVKPWT